MNFDYSENQLMIQQMTQDFAKKEILPNINVWDENEYFPIDLFKKAGKQRINGNFSSRKVWRFRIRL